MDNQEAFGRQGPKAFLFPRLRPSSILAESPLPPTSPRPPDAKPWLQEGREGLGWAGRQRALPEEPFNCPGATRPFYSLVLCLMVYVAIR